MSTSCRGESEPWVLIPSDGINAQTCYDWSMAKGLVIAAERARSPAILQLFPITLKYGGGPFLQYCLDL